MVHQAGLPHLPNVLQENERKRAVKEKNAQRRQKCIDRGGSWTVTNEETGAGSCFIAPPPEEEPTPEAEPITKLTPEERATAEAEGNQIITDRFGTERIQTPTELAEFGGMGAARALRAKEAEEGRIKQ